MKNIIKKIENELKKNDITYNYDPLLFEFNLSTNVTLITIDNISLINIVNKIKINNNMLYLKENDDIILKENIKDIKLFKFNWSFIFLFFIETFIYKFKLNSIKET